ncbi:saccharopine dehydrogenase NADP-binding domain-containing protein [Nocardioides sp. BP30]|uniref:saccharopine dehydrogenase family protein n=1 Tax=Nocardioides sp. BP30 TaxID=3036374 RepID=UPI0024683EA6|nr:saccharopine dehydrogenase NADP-binding domain-containing protein [Nocardioides sp. BP30]WGL51890.1 saccharopine dehydrogenase NADP-binding domain-containing protein [Nocardioides sp. BP30]
MTAARDLDLVLLGATGFTGSLTASYLAEAVSSDGGPHGLRWGLAGRDLTKLGEVRDRLVQRWGQAVAGVELLQADVGDQAGLDAMAARTRVVITTVGPYLEYGEPVVRACAEAGTDYVDLTGEPEFVDEMYVRYHAVAQRTGARIVHACGFDSIPHDLGALFAVRHLDASGPVRMRGVVRASGMLSGGTFHSALGQFSRARQMRAAAEARKRAEPRPEGRRSRAVAGRPHRDPDLGYWLVPLPTIDPAIVARTGRALPAYGPDFSYSHYAGTKTLRYAVGGAAGLLGLVAAAQLGPVRRWLGARIPPGAGPDEARRASSWFRVDLIAEGDGRKVHARVSGGDPGYAETAKMLAESALCLALDDNPPSAGSVTTGVAMGAALTDRLQRAGIRFEIR